MAGSRVDEHVTLRVGRHAGHLAEIEVRRKLQRFDRRLVGELRNDELRRERNARKERRRE